MNDDIGISFFQQRLTNDKPYDHSYWFFLKSETERCIPKIISEEENFWIQEIPSAEEIKKVIFSGDPSSTAGPDGSQDNFFIQLGTLSPQT